MTYPKRLIEVDLPIKRISAHARREKSIRHGHISTIHIWWARRPLAACRAVLCASLWPDPADEICPKEFIDFAKREMLKWCDNDHLQLLSKVSIEHFIKINHNSNLINDKIFLRQLLLDFIADFSNWDNSNHPEFLNTSRNLTRSSHIALGGEKETNPLIVDPFAGGGAIPIESIRIGCEAFASDLNSIPVLLNKIQLEFIPKYGIRLADEVMRLGNIINEIATKELCDYYPEHSKKKPLGYIWARTIQCEGPNCGATVPIIRKLWLATKEKSNIALAFELDNIKKTIGFKIVRNISPFELMAGTVKRGSVTCPLCGHTTAVKNVRIQLEKTSGGTNNAMLLAIRLENRDFVLPNDDDFKALELISEKFREIKDHVVNEMSIFPNEKTPTNKSHRAVGSPFIYGMYTWSDLFTHRQLISLFTLFNLIKSQYSSYDNTDLSFKNALFTCLNVSFSRLIDFTSSLCRLNYTGGRGVANTFGRQALQMVWDFMESNPINPIAANWKVSFSTMNDTICHELNSVTSGSSLFSDATKHPLPDDSCDGFITDPPYYDSVPYGELADFFYVWLKRSLSDIYPELFSRSLSPKKEQAIVLNPNSVEQKANYENKMSQAMIEGVRILKPNGIGVVVFAHKSTSGWESQLQSMLNAGWIITSSWPIDTERSGRVNSQNTASLASSVHLVCRVRENEDGSLIQNKIGDWRDVQEELPKRIHEWMPRLAEEGVAGADAIFACIGPALEIFSRYTQVVQAGSEREISLREYLEKVWAAVSQEALDMVFSGGDAKGLEEDARLTAMWLWTLTSGINDKGIESDDDDNDDENDDESSAKGMTKRGFILEYDTARKIAMGLGANLDELKTLVEVKGNLARLLPVQERANKLFGSVGIQQQLIRRKKKEPQLSLSFENEIPEEETIYQLPEFKVEQTGKTVLDRLHQAMLLFSTGRTEALKRFLVEDGAGKDDRFWQLAQSLTSLYPKDTDERRWVEAIQTYKKSLGF